MTDKTASVEELVGELRSGMTVGFGGWGSRRKPMAVVRAILRSSVRDLTVVSYGGPDVGLLCAGGRVRKVVYGFVTLDSIALDPHFRAAREGGAVEALELDEGMIYLGLLAATWRVPFLPTRAGLGSDVERTRSGDGVPVFRRVVSPYPHAGTGEHEELLAVPALELDAAFVHVNQADTNGNGQVLGPDPFFDDLFLGAAKKRFVTAERLVEPGGLAQGGDLASVVVNRLMTDAVAPAPLGAHFTSCPPDYERDERLQRDYVEAARSGESWSAFVERYVTPDEDGYRRAVAATGEAGGRGS